MPVTKEPVYASQARPWLASYEPKFRDMPTPDCTAFDYICRQNKNHLSDIALMYYGNQITYATLFVQVKKTAAALRAAGVAKGDIITGVSVMTPELIYLFYAADMVGATLNLVDPRYSPDGIHEYIQEARSKLLICLNVCYDKCHQALRRTTVEKVLVFSPADSLKGPMKLAYAAANPDRNRYASNVIHWKEFMAAGKNASTASEPFDPAHSCVMVHTGGTTGSPKGVLLGDTAFNAIAQQFSAFESVFQRQQRLLNVMPPFIAYGYACGVHLPLSLGLTVVIIPKLDPNELGKLILKYKPAHMFGVPSHYQVLAADPRMKKKDLSFVLNLACGGDAIPLGAEQSVNAFLASHGAPYGLAKGYGMTEVCSAATAAAGIHNKLGSVGLPLPSTVVSVFEPGTDQELPIGQRGEICISGPSMMQGYFDKPEETALVMRKHPDGRVWVHTGDIGYMDPEGYVFLDSRIKRMIIRHDGFKIFPSMIENVLSTHPAVANCSVVGCTDKDHVQGRLPLAYIVLNPDCQKKKRQIVRGLPEKEAADRPGAAGPVRRRAARVCAAGGLQVHRQPASDPGGQGELSGTGEADHPAGLLSIACFRGDQFLRAAARQKSFWLRFPVFAAGVVAPLQKTDRIPLALGRFLRRGAVPACINRSAAPASPRCFCRRQRLAAQPAAHSGTPRPAAAPLPGL